MSTQPAAAPHSAGRVTFAAKHPPRVSAVVTCRPAGPLGPTTSEAFKPPTLRPSATLPGPAAPTASSGRTLAAPSCPLKPSACTCQPPGLRAVTTPHPFKCSEPAAGHPAALPGPFSPPASPDRAKAAAYPPLTSCACTSQAAGPLAPTTPTTSAARHSRNPAAGAAPALPGPATPQACPGQALAAADPAPPPSTANTTPPPTSDGWPRDPWPSRCSTAVYAVASDPSDPSASRPLDTFTPASPTPTATLYNLRSYATTLQ